MSGEPIQLSSSSVTVRLPHRLRAATAHLGHCVSLTRRTAPPCRGPHLFPPEKSRSTCSRLLLAGQSGIRSRRGKNALREADQAFLSRQWWRACFPTRTRQPFRTSSRNAHSPAEQPCHESAVFQASRWRWLPTDRDEQISAKGR